MTLNNDSLARDACSVTHKVERSLTKRQLFVRREIGSVPPRSAERSVMKERREGGGKGNGVEGVTGSFFCGADIRKGGPETSF